MAHKQTLPTAGLDAIQIHTDDAPPQTEIVNCYWLISKLEKHPRNFRVHPTYQINDLKAILTRYGQVRSVVVQEQEGSDIGLIVAGHGIIEAMREKDFKWVRADTLPTHWTSLQIEGYLAADNLSSKSAYDDTAMLTQLLQDQHDAGFDLHSIGSSDDELMLLLQQQDAIGDMPDESEPPDEFPEYDEDEPFDYCCPKCNFKWAGKAK